MGTTKEQREELRNIAELATSGEWTVDDANDELVARLVGGAYEYIAITDPSEFSTTKMTYRQCKANARHIAAFSPAMALSLLSDADERDRLAERVRELEHELKYALLDAEHKHDGLSYHYARAKSAESKLAVAVEALEDAVNLLEHTGDIGTCCCGSPVDSHWSGDGHSPVDMWDYAYDRFCSRHADILSKIKGAP